MFVLIVTMFVISFVFCINIKLCSYLNIVFSCLKTTSSIMFSKKMPNFHVCGILCLEILPMRSNFKPPFLIFTVPVV